MNAVTLDWSCVVLLNNVKSFKILLARPEIIFITKSCHILQSQDDVKFINNELKSNLKCLSKETDFVANYFFSVTQTNNIMMGYGRGNLS